MPLPSHSAPPKPICPPATLEFHTYLNNLTTEQTNSVSCEKAFQGNHEQLNCDILADRAILTTRDRLGRLPIHWAILGESFETFEMLVNRGSPMSVEDDNYWSPLMLASYVGMTEAVKILIEDGVDVLRKNKRGHSAPHLAYLVGHEEIFSILLAQLFFNSPIDKYGLSLLHLAVVAEDEDTVAKLLRRFKLIDSKDINGETPLHLACKTGNLEIIQQLLVAGASVNIRNKYRQLPSDFCDNPETAQLFANYRQGDRALGFEH